MARIAIRSAVLVLCLLGFSTPLAAACYWTDVMVTYRVCTDWWDGTRTCQWQQGWEETYVCDVYGGGVPLPPPPDGGGTMPPENPPPHCEIVGISDENPEQPILSVEANEAAVEMTLSYDGYTNQSVHPSAGQFALQPVNYFAVGRTSVGVQCRNNAYVYSNAVMFVDRYATSYRKEENVHGTWIKIKLDDEPQVYEGDWNRAVVLDVVETSYTVPPFGNRNGAYQHISIDDYLTPVGTTPKGNWDDLYVLSSPFGRVERQGWGVRLRVSVGAPLHGCRRVRGRAHAERAFDHHSAGGTVSVLFRSPILKDEQALRRFAAEARRVPEAVRRVYRGQPLEAVYEETVKPLNVPLEAFRNEVTIYGSLERVEKLLATDFVATLRRRLEERARQQAMLAHLRAKIDALAAAANQSPESAADDYLRSLHQRITLRVFDERFQIPNGREVFR